MKKERIKYLVQIRTKEKETILQEKSGYLIRIESIEPDEYLYFLVAHDIDKEGNVLNTWCIDEYYTGLKLFGGHPTRNAAIQQLILYWQERKHTFLIRQVKKAINLMKSQSTLANVNPENYNHSVNDLSYMAYGKMVSKHVK